MSGKLIKILFRDCCEFLFEDVEMYNCVFILQDYPLETSTLALLVSTNELNRQLTPNGCGEEIRTTINLLIIFDLYQY